MYTSSQSSLTTLALSCGAAVFLFFSALISSGELLAEGHFVEPSRDHPQMTGPVASRADLPLVRPRLDPADEIAALEAVEIALTQAGDGATYVWQHGNGRLGGAVRMTNTFRDADGRICRHLQMQMRHGSYARTTEGIACRTADGVWVLEG